MGRSATTARARCRAERSVVGIRRDSLLLPRFYAIRRDCSHRCRGLRWLSNGGVEGMPRRSGLDALYLPARNHGLKPCSDGDGSTAAAGSDAPDRCHRAPGRTHVDAVSCKLRSSGAVLEVSYTQNPPSVAYPLSRETWYAEGRARSESSGATGADRVLTARSTMTQIFTPFGAEPNGVLLFSHLEHGTAPA